MCRVMLEFPQKSAIFVCPDSDKVVIRKGVATSVLARAPRNYQERLLATLLPAIGRSIVIMVAVLKSSKQPTTSSFRRETQLRNAAFKSGLGESAIVPDVGPLLCSALFPSPHPSYDPTAAFPTPLHVVHAHQNGAIRKSSWLEEFGFCWL